MRGAALGLCALLTGLAAQAVEVVAWTPYETRLEGVGTDVGLMCWYGWDSWGDWPRDACVPGSNSDGHAWCHVAVQRGPDPAGRPTTGRIVRCDHVVPDGQQDLTVGDSWFDAAGVVHSELIAYGPASFRAYWCVGGTVWWDYDSWTCSRLSDEAVVFAGAPLPPPPQPATTWDAPWFTGR